MQTARNQEDRMETWFSEAMKSRTPGVPVAVCSDWGSLRLPRSPEDPVLSWRSGPDHVPIQVSAAGAAS